MFRTSLALIASLSLTACGGGLGSLFANPQTVQMQSAPADSGYAWSYAATVHTSDTTQFLVGDGITNGTAHSFVRFSLALIPAGAKITDARLVMGQESIHNDPYNEIGPAMRVDHVDMGAGFDISDMTFPNVIQALSVMSSNSNLEAKEADVESAVEYAMDHNMPYVDLRLRMDVPTNNDNGQDWSRLNNEADDGGSGIRPTLIVTYEE